jgi:hypothetical protein
MNLAIMQSYTGLCAYFNELLQILHTGAVFYMKRLTYSSFLHEEVNPQQVLTKSGSPAPA